MVDDAPAKRGPDRHPREEQAGAKTEDARTAGAASGRNNVFVVGADRCDGSTQSLT